MLGPGHHQSLASALRRRVRMEPSRPSLSAGDPPPMGGGSSGDHHPDTLPGPGLHSLQDEAPVAFGEPVIDGTECEDTVTRLLFPDDDRVREVRRMLCTSRAKSQRLTEDLLGDTAGAIAGAGAGEFASASPQSHRVLSLALRTLAVPLGRGALTLSTARKTLAEPLHVPPLTLDVRVPPNEALLHPDLESLGLPLESLMGWPSFHNGVAAALRLPPVIDGTAPSFGEHLISSHGSSRKGVG